ncbi:floral homeotic protein PMADS 2-like [Bidens hawaiensis]|uniref:floral homeotic protein PMADS 2-like n=1 Tax=Bidens hawaiensis TaxID=980011 RepID=UPI00404A0221
MTSYKEDIISCRCFGTRISLKILLLIRRKASKVLVHLAIVSATFRLIDMLDRYQRLSGNKLWDAKHENLQNEIDRIKKENDSMQIELRHLKGEDITSLTYEELIGYEEALENGLTNIRERKDEIPKIMRKREQVLEEENKHLIYLMQQNEMAAMGDYQADEPPFSFSVQPMQPNLQERM